MASFATKSVLKCDRTSHGRKRAARTHIARTFQNAFRTHIAHVRVCAHVCVCESNFATHSLTIIHSSIPKFTSYSQISGGQLSHPLGMVGKQSSIQNEIPVSTKYLSE